MAQITRAVFPATEQFSDTPPTTQQCVHVRTDPGDSIHHSKGIAAWTGELTRTSSFALMLYIL